MPDMKSATEQLEASQARMDQEEYIFRQYVSEMSPVSVQAALKIKAIALEKTCRQHCGYLKGPDRNGSA